MEKTLKEEYGCNVPLDEKTKIVLVALSQAIREYGMNLHLPLEGVHEFYEVCFRNIDELILSITGYLKEMGIDEKTTIDPLVFIGRIPNYSKELE